MAFQGSIRLLPLPSSALKSLCTVILLLIVCSVSLLSCSHADYFCCKCPGSDDPNKFCKNTTFDEIEGDLYSSINSSTSGLQYAGGGLEDYRIQNPSALNLSYPAGLIVRDYDDMFYLDDAGLPYNYSPSFSIEFNMNLYQPKEVSGGSLIFAIIPSAAYFSVLHGGYNSYPTNVRITQLVDMLISCPDKFIIYNQTESLTGVSNGSNVHFQAGGFPFKYILLNYGLCLEKEDYCSIDTIIFVKITITPPTEAGVSVLSSDSDYRISIDYPHESYMFIQVIKLDPDVQPYSGIPASANIPINIIRNGNFTSQVAFFSFFSSMGQLLQLHSYNLTLELLPKGVPTPATGVNVITIIQLSVLGSAAATAVMAALVYWYFKSKYRGWKKDLDELAKTIQLLPGVPTQFDFADIKKATNNFHEMMRLGRGAFGTVYKCRLRLPKRVEEMEVAVKKFSRDDNRRYEDFLTEVSVINRLRHKNIVPLVGWSYHKGEPLLIYEFMPNGSLDHHLFRRGCSTTQQQQQQEASPIHRWTTRYNMVKDIATGLHYVHHEYEPMVLHRDIKASNIMIDATFQARLGDFGLACVVAQGKNSYTDLGAPGTIGFMAPEYIYSGKATTKSDVFAFGVLVLEIVTGKTAVKNPQFSHITDWVWQHHREDKLLDAVDPALRSSEEFDAGDARRLLLLGLACSNPRPSDRPTMVEAVQIVAKAARLPDVPLEIPRFLWPPPEEEGVSALGSEFSTEVSNLDSGLSLTTVEVEMAAGGGGQASSSCGNGGNGLRQSPSIGRPSQSQEVFSVYHTAPASHRRAFTGV